MSRTFAVAVAVSALVVLGVMLSCVYSVYQTQQATDRKPPLQSRWDKTVRATRRDSPRTLDPESY